MNTEDIIAEIERRIGRLVAEIHYRPTGMEAQAAKLNELQSLLDWIKSKQLNG